MSQTSQTNPEMGPNGIELEPPQGDLLGTGQKGIGIMPRQQILEAIKAMQEAEATAKANEEILRRDIPSFSKSIYKFVMYSFPWGVGELKEFTGPDEWQTKILKDIDAGLITPHVAIQIATASGHGIGKGALVSWIILWSLSTFEDTKGIVTANTENQLKLKTWAELAKWYRLFVAKHWFVMTATSIYSAQDDHRQTWRFDMVAWSENNTEAFAGLHNQGKRIVILFDEASGIVDKIWEVIEGALTDSDTQILWLVFGNMTRNTGRFVDCFSKFRHRWKTYQVDSRTVKITNKEQIQKWIDDLGEDSDFVRVRVRGVAPKSSEHQFISSAIVELARGKYIPLHSYSFAPKILTLDNAWTGGDEIVIGMRQGNVFWVKATFQKNDDDTFIGGNLARIEDEEKADGVLIDLGYGTGVYSYGTNILKRDWTLIPFGGESPTIGYTNMRAYMWAQMKKWLQEGGCIPDDPILCAQITGPEAYVVATGHNAGKIYLESKKDMKARGVESPNRADTLAMSFAINIKPKEPNLNTMRLEETIRSKQKAYHPLDTSRYVGAA